MNNVFKYDKDGNVIQSEEAERVQRIKLSRLLLKNPEELEKYAESFEYFGGGTKQEYINMIKERAAQEI